MRRPIVPADRFGPVPTVSDVGWPPPSASGQRRPAPVGSLGRAFAGALSRTQTIVLIATAAITLFIVAVGLPSLAGPASDAVGPTLAIWLLGALAWSALLVAAAIVAILPPLLLRGPDRRAFAAHAWIGAREARALLGRAARVTSLPTDGPTALAWLEREPRRDGNGRARVDAWLLAGRLEEARAEAESLPERTPFEVYGRLEALALVADQGGEPVDEDALRAALARIPAGVDRTEATVSLAVFRARRALPEGDWRGPLLEARPLIPGSDARIIVADFGLPVSEILVRRAAVPIGLVLLAIAVAFTLLSAPR